MITFDQFLNDVPFYPDADQLKAINADTNCVVSAGAGSGKTMVLSYRFVRLVLERKARFDQILTLTFTRKAAREMHQRIHEYLFRCKEDEEIRSQLASFSNAPISTIDSFCAQVVKSNAYEYGLSGEFKVDDEENLTLARRVAIELLEENPQDPGAKILSSIYSPDVIIEDVLLKLSTRYPLGSTFDEQIVDEIRRAVDEEYKTLLNHFETYLIRYQGLAAGGGGKTHQKIAEFTTTFLALLETAEGESLWRVFTGRLGYFTKVGSNVKDEALVLIRDSQEEYGEIRKKLAICSAFFLNEDHLRAVVAFVARFLKEHRTRKRASSVVSFSDISHLAVKTLTDNKELRAYYKETFRYIMIDEFQDNNEEQKQLLYLLAEQEGHEGDGIPTAANLAPDKLFFVGDEKQSIYRFRGSDVSVFKALSDELKAIGGQSVQLPKNYRSEPELITWFNEVFPSIMTHEGQSFEADFEPLEFRQAQEGIDPKITLAIKPYVVSTDDEEEEVAESSLAEAYYLAQKIDEILKGDEYLIPSRSGARKPEPHDIAILLRSTSSQLHFERALRLFSIPYTVQMARSLFLEAITNDFYALLQLLLYPSDTLSYAVVLRSPFCFINDSALADLLQEELFTPVVSLSEIDRKKLLNLKAFFEELKEAATLQRLERLVFMLWHESGYAHYYLQNPNYHAYIEHYELLYRVAQTFGEEGKTLSDFLDYLRERLGQNERLEELDLIKEKEEGVQIMSVHKSKGLEFPIVIVANAGSKGRGDDTTLSSVLGYTLPNYLDETIEVSERGKKEQVKNIDGLFDEGVLAQQEYAELKRLLYVAVTRAETHLIISGSFNRQNRSIDGTRSTFLLLLAQALGIDPDIPSLEHDKIAFDIIEDVPATEFYRTTAAKISIEERRSWYETVEGPYKGQTLRYAVTALAPETEFSFTNALPEITSDSFLIEKEYGAHFGTFVHRLIEANLAKEDLTDPLFFMEEAFKAQLTKSEKESVLSDALLLSDHFIQSQLCKTEVLNHPFKTEMSFFSREEHDGRTVVVEGAIDLLVDQGDEIVVIDFKSDRFVDEEAHRFQIETYISAAQRLYKKKTRGLIVYLRDVEQSIHYEST